MEKETNKKLAVLKFEQKKIQLKLFVDNKLLLLSGKNVPNYKYVPFCSINGIPLCKTIVNSGLFLKLPPSKLPRLQEFDKETLEFDWLDIFRVTNQKREENKQ